MLATRQFSRNIYIQNWLLFAIVAILLGVLVSVALQNFGRPSDQPAWAQPAFTACEKQVLSDLRVERTEFTLLANIETLCFNNLRHESLISIFEVNRSIYVEQNVEDRVLMWMVVVITISGVVLAGLQLLASYKLASAGKSPFDKENEISIEKDRLSLKSAVTGLMVLLISLGFFTIYVKYVYKIEPPAELSDSKQGGTDEQLPFRIVNGPQPLVGGAAPLGPQLPQPATNAANGGSSDQVPDAAQPFPPPESR